MTRTRTDDRADGATVAHFVRLASRKLVWTTPYSTDKSKQKHAVVLVPLPSTTTGYRHRPAAGAAPRRGDLVGHDHVPRARERARRADAPGRLYDRGACRSRPRLSRRQGRDPALESQGPRAQRVAGGGSVPPCHGRARDD